MATYSQQHGVLAVVGADILSLQYTTSRFQIKTATFPAPIGGDEH